MTLTFPEGFLWGAATAAHQVEGDNTGNDVWAVEHRPGSPFSELSLRACDSYRRYREDIGLVAELGLGAYRFSLEWSRIEPAPGSFDSAALAHYSDMVQECLARGVRPVVTLHHFTSPQWFARDGGWLSPGSPSQFARFCESLSNVLHEVPVVCTINEPNVLDEQAHLLADPVQPAQASLARSHLLRAHELAVDVVKGFGVAEVGLTVSMEEVRAVPGEEDAAEAYRYRKQGSLLERLRDDDFVGVQAYTAVLVGRDGLVPPAADERTTQTGWRVAPSALASAVREAAAVTGRPVHVTENGIATADDQQRIDYMTSALRGLHYAIEDGVDVRSYFAWSLLDNYEWMHGYGPTFGLVAVDRQSFRRQVKLSGAWFAGVARTAAVPA